MMKCDSEEFKTRMENLNSVYSIDNFIVESMAWYDYWHQQNSDKDLEYVQYIKYTYFYPAIKTALTILLTLPATTCSIEHVVKIIFFSVISFI